MRIALVSRADISNVRSSSGYPYFMAKALERHVGEVVFLSPDESLVTSLIEKCGRGLDRASFAVFRRRLAGDQNRVLSSRLAHVFGGRLSLSDCDVVFGPNAAVEICSISTSVPIVYSTDQNWADMVNYYPTMTSLFRFAMTEGDRVEAAAIRKAAAVLYPSNWAATTAVTHYGANPEKVHIVPWGANFNAEDLPTREQACRHPLQGEITLLWIGVDWERKGGPIAYECLMDLLEKNVAAKLMICGCSPPERFRHPRITVAPFLDKGNPTDRARLSQMFLGAHFFVFPTMAEAYGIVLCEASAHGLPLLVRNTGGINGAVEDGANGCILPPEAGGKRYAERILEFLRDPMKYDRLVRSSRDTFEERLNWDAWGRSVRPIFEGAANGNSRSAETVKCAI